jgi:thiamine biosynthesis protein ThiS
MTLFLNGEPVEVAARLSVAEMLDLQGLPRAGIAVERNREIVPKSRFGDTFLSDGDRIEIVQFVGGG